DRLMKEFGAVVVAPDEIYRSDADIFAPCALGGIINDDTMPQFKVEIIAGGANNQLLEERHGNELESRGILYAPDYAANAGGVINGCASCWVGKHRNPRRKLMRFMRQCSTSSAPPKPRAFRPTKPQIVWRKRDYKTISEGHPQITQISQNHCQENNARRGHRSFCVICVICGLSATFTSQTARQLTSHQHAPKPS